MKTLKGLIMSTVFLFIAGGVNGQSSLGSQFNFETVVGLAFYNQTITVINQEELLPEDLQPENYLRFQIIPKLNFMTLNNKLSFGTHLGFGYESFKIPERSNEQQTASLFKVGGQLQYEILKFYGIRPYVELGSNYNLYEAPDILNNSNGTVSYFKSYLDVGLRVQVGKSIDVSLLFKDFITYHSNATNFERAEDVTLRPSIQDFVEFAHFSIRFTL